MYSVFKRKITAVKTQDIIALLLLVATALFFCWKSHFSIGHDDESWYLTFPLRLTMGDSPLVDEWHLGQLFGFLLYLPVKAYLCIFNSTDGIVLFFRYVYIAFQGMIATFIYWRLRKKGVFSIVAAILYFSFIPLTIMALSYNSLGLAFVELVGVLLVSSKQFSKKTFYITGIFMACSVLCNPTLVLIFLVYSVCVLLHETTKNKKHQLLNFAESNFSAKAWLWILLGIMTMGILYFSFLFSRTTLTEIIQNFPMLLTDPDYVLSDGQNVFDLLDSILKIVRYNGYIFLGFLLLMISIALDKKRIAHRLQYLIAACVIFFIYFIKIIPSSPLAPILGMYTGTYTLDEGIPCLLMMFPITLLGFCCYTLSQNKNKDMLVFLWGLGVLYAICLDISSDFAPWTSSFGFAVSATASIFFIKNCIDEILQQVRNNANLKHLTYTMKKRNYKEKLRRITIFSKVVVTALVLTIALQTIAQFYLAANYKKSSMEYLVDPPTQALNVKIKSGPLKGLKTTPRVEKLYNIVLDDLAVIKEDGKQPFLTTNNYAWPYLYLNTPYASYNPFITDWFTASKTRLPKYYELHPDKIPGYIYVFKIYDTFYNTIPVDAESIVADIQNKYSTLIVKESEMGYVVKIAQQ